MYLKFSIHTSSAGGYFALKLTKERTPWFLKVFSMVAAIGFEPMTLRVWSGLWPLREGLSHNKKRETQLRFMPQLASISPTLYHSPFNFQTSLKQLWNYLDNTSKQHPHYFETSLKHNYERSAFTLRSFFLKRNSKNTTSYVKVTGSKSRHDTI